MVAERLVVDHDPDDPDRAASREHEVIMRIDVPPPAKSNGWGEIPKGRRR